MSPGVPVKGLAVAKPKKVKVANQANRVFGAADTTWPRAATGSVAVSPPAAGLTAGPASRIAGTPVWAQAVGGGSDGSYDGPPRVSAKVLPHARAAALGISAVVFQVSGSSPADGPVRIGLDYAQFAQAYGGNYGSRLRASLRADHPATRGLPPADPAGLGPGLPGSEHIGGGQPRHADRTRARVGHPRPPAPTEDADPRIT